VAVVVVEELVLVVDEELVVELDVVVVVDHTLLAARSRSSAVKYALSSAVLPGF
jgi:hypothetical protein